MDADRFDSLLRAFATTPSRRHALRFLAGSALGSLWGLEQLKTRAKKGKGKGHGKRKRKKCVDSSQITICHKGQTLSVSNCALPAHLAHGDTQGACPTPSPTCTDSIKNGSESDVDCGGICPRCGEGKTCNTRDDCGTAFCRASTGTCVQCEGAGDCPDDPATGTCSCVAFTGQGSKCVRFVTLKANCVSCPDPNLCTLSGSTVDCYALCGTA
jgi:hypothetical protein